MRQYNCLVPYVQTLNYTLVECITEFTVVQYIDDYLIACYVCDFNVYLFVAYRVIISYRE